MSQDKPDTFCVYPWMHQVVLPPGSLGFCCVAKHGGPVLTEDQKQMKVPEAQLSTAWNSEFQKNIRKKMLNGEKVENCKLCYYQESIGKDSYRKMHNQEWLSEKHSEEINKRIEYSKKNGFRVEGGALYLDLRLGNLCNLKCRMCNPYNSTKIAAETDQLLKTDQNFKHLYKKYYGHDEVQKTPKWYEEQSFWDNIYEQLPSLRKVYLTGGEPTLIKQNYEFLKKCVASGHSKHIFLMFNINCTTLTDEFLSYLPHFEFVLVNASIDGIGELNSYIRGGSEWSTIDTNFKKLLQLKGNIQIGMTPTVQIYNVLGMVDLLEYFQKTTLKYKKNVNLDFLYVTAPAYLDIRFLPKIVKDLALRKIQTYAKKEERFIKSNSYLANSILSLQNALKSEMEDKSKLEEFISYTRSLDRYRQENFNQALPELSNSLGEAGFIL